jgi:uncharacterized membrane protein YkvA (DUF1232 family)
LFEGGHAAMTSQISDGLDVALRIETTGHMLQGFRKIAASLKRELVLYRALAAHPRTPRLAKWCLLAAVGYAVLPIDLIPDFIPVIGHLDDVVIVPGLIAAAIWLVPKDVVVECRQSTA